MTISLILVALTLLYTVSGQCCREKVTECIHPFLISSFKQLFHKEVERNKLIHEIIFLLQKRHRLCWLVFQYVKSQFGIEISLIK